LRSNLFKGAAGEYKAAAYYLDNNCIVYWPAVPLETDFLVERPDGTLDKVQVKATAWRTSKSRPYEHLHVRTYGWAGGRKKTDTGPLYDYLFVVCEDGRMWEIPASELPEHAIGLDSRGGTTRKETHKWDKYLVTTQHH
jgi:hypothetical protein